jgi:hypothetical protein
VPVCQIRKVYNPIFLEVLLRLTRSVSSLKSAMLHVGRRTIPMEEAAKICPECGHEFKGNGFDGIDAHWRANHEASCRTKTLGH